MSEWYIQEDDYMWQLFEHRGVDHPRQIAKCVKRTLAFEPYWPTPEDARLIVAAPQLLEALKAVAWEVIGGCPACHNSRYKGHNSDCIVAQALAAAEGDTDE